MPTETIIGHKDNLFIPTTGMGSGKSRSWSTPTSPNTYGLPGWACLNTSKLQVSAR